MAYACPPALQIAGESACADYAQVILFGKVFNRDYVCHIKVNSKLALQSS